MIVCKLSCKMCELPLTEFTVRCRFANETMAHYLQDAVMPTAKMVHFERSPMCLARECELRVPEDNTEPMVSMMTRLKDFREDEG